MSPSILAQPFSLRADSEDLPALSNYLLSLIAIKHSNLCVAADVHSTSALLQLAEEVGDSICMLKTHADIIDDFSERSIQGLQEIASRKHFLIFEDRKFGDIGNTVESQYSRGPLHIASWAHITNAHIFPGPAVITSLQAAATSTLLSLNQSVSTEISTGTPRLSVDGSIPDSDRETDRVRAKTDGPDAPTLITSAPHTTSVPIRSTNSPNSTAAAGPMSASLDHSVVTATTTISQTISPSATHPASFTRSLSASSDDPSSALATLGPPPHARGLLLLAQMSSANNHLTPAYTAACLAAARENKGFVLGFIAQESMNREPEDRFLSVVPGVHLGENGDGKGQRWKGPLEVVRDEGADVVIVGRGVLGAKDRRAEAERYRMEAWKGYEERVDRRK
ncbi:MAG: hypothetical protein Q9167_006345 [Letrouitia subvulpina]